MGSAGGGGKKRKRDRERDRERERERSRRRKAARAAAAAAAAEQQEVEEDVWAQCERCDKWRRLPPGTEVDEERPWYCSMNPNKAQNRCEVAEEEYSDVYIEPQAGTEVPGSKQHMNGGLAGSGGNVSTGKPPSGKAKAGKRKKTGRKHPRQLGPTILGQHQKVLTVGLGSATGWAAGQSSGPASARITLDLWRSLHMITPALGAAASSAANEASAASYFSAAEPNGAALSASATEFARVALTASAAVAKGLSDRYVAEVRATVGTGKPPLPAQSTATNGPPNSAAATTSSSPAVSLPLVATATLPAPQPSLPLASTAVTTAPAAGSMGAMQRTSIPGTMPTPGMTPSARPSPLGLRAISTPDISLPVASSSAGKEAYPRTMLSPPTVPSATPTSHLPGTSTRPEPGLPAPTSNADSVPLEILPQAVISTAITSELPPPTGEAAWSEVQNPVEAKGAEVRDSATAAGTEEDHEAPFQSTTKPPTR